ncbi:MAG: putative malonyl-CoA decarboxylase [Candidatus Xenolissoclinum pacificiensis L6]|uniref:Malonyl-CoA decarboxylase n=1 Tax=Candidatus Xenolissoclinum pacificiensis L6 TaxID=1401685 RepID=W2V050_9RICK|nr:MAG: putative malonyl-CoA decarboxylase [Candidatus Xenolissoclinum pacificiensis L6]
MSTSILRAFSKIHNYSWLKLIKLFPVEKSKPAILGIAELKDKKSVAVLESAVKDFVSPNLDNSQIMRNSVMLGNLYMILNVEDKKKFLHILKDSCDVDIDALKTAIDLCYQDEYSDKSRLKLINILHSGRNRIFRQFVFVQDGLKFLVDMRADLIEYSKEDKTLKPLADELKVILSSWFDTGLLDLVRITWDDKASLLEKIMRYEAVHEIESWEDLHCRLSGNKHCYAFFHYKMPDEPLIFVEIYLSNKVEVKMHDLLLRNENYLMEKDSDSGLTHVIFYSISNTQKGLLGINLGNFLIKRVVDKIHCDLPNVKYFYTLSPITGFRSWLKHECEKNSWNFNVDKERVLSLVYENDFSNHDDIDSLKEGLMSLCAYYLSTAVDEKGKHYDAVANFHLSNGASIYGINWMSDISNKGLHQSFGMMVNYEYDVNSISDRYIGFTSNKKIEVSKTVANMHKNIKKIGVL